jgi:hypothetical protein
VSPATWALIGAALPFAVGIVALVKAWLRGREVAKVRGQLERAELERDAAGGRAAVAEAEREVLTDHVDRQEAAAEVAEELRDAAPVGLDPDVRRARLHERVRAHARGAGVGPSGGDAPAVRPPAAAGAGGDDDGR